MTSLSRPPCSPFDLPATRGLSHPHCYFTMADVNNTFIVSSTTALSMGEHLIHALNNIVVNLPVPELHKICGELRRTVRVAEDILYSEDIPAGFDMLTLNDGTC